MSVDDVDSHLVVCPDTRGRVGRDRYANNTARPVGRSRREVALETLREAGVTVFTGAARALCVEPIGAPIHGHESRWSSKGGEVRIGGCVGPQAEGIGATAEILIRDQPKAVPDDIAS